MNRLKQLIGETKAIFASVLCLLALVLLAPGAQAADSTPNYLTFTAKEADSTVKSEDVAIVYFDPGEGADVDPAKIALGCYNVYTNDVFELPAAATFATRHWTSVRSDLHFFGWSFKGATCFGDTQQTFGKFTVGETNVLTAVWTNMPVIAGAVARCADKAAISAIGFTNKLQATVFAGGTETNRYAVAVPEGFYDVQFAYSNGSLNMSTELVTNDVSKGAACDSFGRAAMSSYLLYQTPANEPKVLAGGLASVPGGSQTYLRVSPVTTDDPAYEALTNAVGTRQATLYGLALYTNFVSTSVSPTPLTLLLPHETAVYANCSNTWTIYRVAGGVLDKLTTTTNAAGEGFAVEDGYLKLDVRTIGSLAVVPPGLVPVKYLDADGNEQTTNALVVTKSAARVTWNAGWYVVPNEVTVTGGADCSGGEVNLILADTGALTISGVDKNKAGIAVTNANSLAIYGQAAGTGALTVTGGLYGAGIGGGREGVGNNITINGGTVKATGGGAGIGGGTCGGGSGPYCNGSYITINGGTVTAESTSSGAGIGGGEYGVGLYITINGGTVTATGANGCWGIGNGHDVMGVASDSIKAAEDVIVKAGTAANPTTEIAHNGMTDLATDNDFKGKRYVTTVLLPTEPIGFSVKAPEHATAAVYTNTPAGAAVQVPEGGTVGSNRTANVRYDVMTDKYWYFKKSDSEWVKFIAHKLDTTVDPAIDRQELPEIVEASCIRTVLQSGQSTNLVEGMTYTAAPTTEDGGVFHATGEYESETALVGKNVIFKGNVAGSGGAIYNAGDVNCSVELDGVVFTDNTANSGNGGAICNNGGFLVLGDVAFTNNTVKTGNSLSGAGGAIYNAGSINIRGNVTLGTETDTLYNTKTLDWILAEGDQGVLHGYQHLVNSGDDASMKVFYDYLFEHELPFGLTIATGDFSDVSGKDTFTIISVELDNFFVTKATINGPLVAVLDGQYGFRLVTEGEGETARLNLYAYELVPRIVVEAGDVATNLVSGTVYTALPTNEPGGAVNVQRGAALTGTNVVFEANEALYGGAINNYGNVALKDAAFTGNKARAQGGAINNGGMLSLDGVTFDGNKATEAGGAIFNALAAVNFDGAVTLKTETDTIYNLGTLNWNLADGKQGLLNGYQNITNEGAKATLQLTVEDYQATTNFTLATGDFSDTAGKDTFSITNVAGGAALTGLTIDGDTVVSEDKWHGYQLVTEEDLSVPTTNLVLYVTKYTCVRAEIAEGESTNLADKVYTAAPTDEDGGAFKLNTGATLTGTNVTFAANESSIDGGAIVNCDGTVALKNATFTGNKALKGGAIANFFGTLSLDGVTFEGNKASDSGAIYNEGTVHFDGPVVLVTSDDTIANFAPLNWNLVNGKQGFLGGYDKLINKGGKLQLTVEDYATTNFVIATGDFSDVKDKDTFTITNVTSGASPATATIKIGGVALLNGTWWSLKVEEPKKLKKALAAAMTSRLVLATVPAEELAQLTNVAVVDEKGATNATAVVKVGDTVVQQNPDGSYTVPKGYAVTLEYQAADDYMVGPGWTTKTVVLEPLQDDLSMDDTGLKPLAGPRWVDVREVAIDTRERIVVESPNEVLPIAYHTNGWGAVDYSKAIPGTHSTIVTLYVNGKVEKNVMNQNGYYEWMPETGAYGAYDIKQEWTFDGMIAGSTNATIYYSARSPLTWAEPEDGTVAVTLAGTALTNGTPVLGYELVNLAATADKHYQFTRWSATTNGVKMADKAFGDDREAVTTFEMPNAAAELTAAIDWQSYFTDKKVVNEGETWEVFAGDDYDKDLENSGTVVWKPGVTNKLGIAFRLEDFGQLQNKQGGKLQIVFDASLTNGTYLIAGNAGLALGQVFEITNGSDAKDCTVVNGNVLETAAWVYVGAKRFKLYVDSGYDLQLLVEWGIPQAVVFGADYGEIAASTNGGALFSGETIYPGETVSVTVTPEKDWQLVAWEGEDALGKPVAFDDPAAAATTFRMAETSVVVTAVLKVSDQLVADVLFVITNEARIAIETVDGFAIPETTKQLTAYEINFAKDRLIEALSNAATPSEVYGVRDSVRSTYSYYVEKVRPAGSPEYAVAVAAEPATAGTAKADVSKAKVGETVTLTATVTAKDYEFDRWTGTDATGAAVSFVTPYNLVTTFAMPATNVSVTATFKVSGDWRAQAAQNVLKAQTGANAALAKLGNLTSAEYADCTNRVADIVAEQLRAIAGAATPAEVAAAEKKALADIASVVEEATAYATTPHEILRSDYPTGGGTMSVTNEAVVHTAVTVTAKPKYGSEFTGWTGEADDGTELVFADVTNLVTTFEMPATNVLVTAWYKVAEFYAEEAREAITNAAAAARAEIAGLALADEEKAGFVKRIDDIEREKLLTVDHARSPGDVDYAVESAAKKFNETVEEAKELAVRLHTIEAGAVPADGGEVTVTNAAASGATVEVAAEAADWSWTFVGWAGEDAAGVPLVFEDAAAAVTTFAMPATNVFVAASFKVSGEYVEAAIEAVTNGAEAAYAKVDALEELLPADREAAYAAIYAAETNALLALETVETPSEADVAVEAAETAYAAAVAAAERKSFATVRFAAKTVEGVEGEEIEVVVEGGSNVKPTQVTVSLQKNTLTSFTAYYGLDAKGKAKRATFPLVLDWEEGDREAKVITFVTPATPKKVEVDRFLTLQLGSEAAITVGENDVCTLTVCDAGLPMEDPTPYVRALAWPANGGKVSGFGALAVNKKTGEVTATRTLTATANKWATFAGWYCAKADDPNAIDLGRPVEPVSAKKPNQIKVGKGTEYVESATFFAYFTDVTPVASVDVPDASAPGAAGVVREEGAYVGTVGVKFALPVSFQDETGKGTLTVSGLPAGLAYNKKTGRIEGVPTAVSEKTVKFVAKNVAGGQTATFDFSVEALDALAIGNFAGVVTDNVEGEPYRAGCGSVTFTAGKTGALSAKVTTRLSGTRSFSVKGYDRIDADTLGIAMTNATKEVFEATLSLTNGLYGTVVAGRAYGLDPTKKGTLAYNDEGGMVVAVRNAFLKADKNKEAQAILDTYKGTYSATLFDAATNKAGTVTYKVSDNGNVTVKAVIDATQDGAKKVAKKTMSGTVAGGFAWNPETSEAGLATALRSGTTLWSCEVLFDNEKDTAAGPARYIRPNAEDKTAVVDVDQIVGE